MSLRQVVLLMCMFLYAAPGVAAEPSESVGAEVQKPWYELRRSDTPGYHFPHNLHEQSLDEAGLSCISCHTFDSNSEHDPKIVSELTRIANEPMEAICHSCHVVDRSAPMECRLCHLDPSSIWPADHNFDYLNQHGLDGTFDEQACTSCHVDLRDCVSCHFQRSLDTDYHTPGFRYSHGIEARAMPVNCGSCHNPGFCADCHAQIRY